MIINDTRFQNTQFLRNPSDVRASDVKAQTLSHAETVLVSRTPTVLGASDTSPVSLWRRAKMTQVHCCKILLQDNIQDVRQLPWILQVIARK